MCIGLFLNIIISIRVEIDIEHKAVFSALLANHGKKQSLVDSSIEQIGFEILILNLLNHTKMI